jgi:hypothetical protein
MARETREGEKLIWQLNVKRLQLLPVFPAVNSSYHLFVFFTYIPLHGFPVLEEGVVARFDLG